MGYFRHSVLALKVLLWVLLASFAVFAAATAFGIAYERTKALQHAQVDAEDAARQSLSAIGMSLWQFDVAGLHAALNGLVLTGSVVRAEVLGLDKVIADVHQPGFASSVDRVWSLPVLALDQKTVIGTLRISESYAQANAQVADTMITLVLTDLIKIIGLALVLFVIVYRKVARHLHQLAHDVTRLGDADRAKRLVLDRKTSNRRDEIDILVDAVNEFVTERKQANEALRIAATAFESPGKVKSGTGARTARSTPSGSPSAPSGIKPGQTTHYVAIFSDISERVQAQAQIDTLAFYDPLTHLPNRRLLLDRLSRLARASTRHARKKCLAVC
jgi:methyl-accepting chemotaxis protein